MQTMLDSKEPFSYLATATILGLLGPFTKRKNKLLADPHFYNNYLFT